jgi:hypothetical protein
MKLEYAIVSSDRNPEYLDYWPYVAKMWQRIGIKPVLFYIDREPPADNAEECGIVHHVQPIDWEISQQAQCIRFWAAKVLDKPFIISDIDMLPISKEYYENGASQIGDKGIVSYSSDIIKYRWYRTNPQYPMCYLAGDPETFINVLDMKEETPDQFLTRMKNLRIRFGTDQKFFYNQARRSPDSIKHLERGWIDEKYATGRLDKAIWPKNDYNPEEYIDCHLPRPLGDSNNKNLCENLFRKLNLI